MIYSFVKIFAQVFMTELVCSSFPLTLAGWKLQKGKHHKSKCFSQK